MESKEIKVYGTLVNYTTIPSQENGGDQTRVDSQHNDAIAYAYQLYDDRFGATPNVQNYQDYINKRLTDISYNNGTTTIENRTPISEDHYTLVVNGDTNLNGDVHITEDLHVDGDTYVDGDLHITGQTDLTLGDLYNVNKNADSASAGTFLKYDGSEWLPVNIALSDTFGDIGNPFEGAILKYKNDAWTLTVDEDHDTNRLNNMHDVDISNISNGSILKWNTSTDMWEIGSDLGSILPQGQEGKVLKYINGNWVVADDLGATKMSELSDVDTTGIAVDKILKWDGTKWVIGTYESGASLNQPLSSINSAGLSAPSAANNILMWDGSAWVYTTIDAISFVDSDIDNTPRTLKQWITYLNTAIGNSNMWEADTNNANRIRPKNSKAVTAPGFYDSSISAS